MFKFRPSTIPTNIFVVGCGGTGSRLVPALVQFIRSITKEHTPTGWLGSTNIVLVDGDVVEQKNLLRQNFIGSDVGKNKAAVLANRYSKAYGMNVVAYPKFIEKGMGPTAFRSDLINVSGLSIESHTNDMVIMCVDSAEARRIVLAAVGPVSSSRRTVFIDAGNEDAFGQVRMFTNDILYQSSYDNQEEFKTKYKKPERIAYTPEPVSFIPYDHEFYDNLQDNPGLGSCADLDQTLAINSLMAMHILAFVQNYYYNKVIDYHQISIDIGSGAAYYTKNDITTYRNSTLAYGHKDYSNLGMGGNKGFVGVCNCALAGDVFDPFLIRNKAELKKIENAMAAALKGAGEGENPVAEEVVKAKKPRSKKLEALEEVNTTLVDAIRSETEGPVRFHTSENTIADSWVD